MNLLSTRHLLAITAIVDVALNAEMGSPASAKGIAGRLNQHPRYFETIFQEFVRTKILKSVRGPKGGYSLARNAREVTVAEIVRNTHSYSSDEERTASLLAADVVGPAIEKAGKPFLAELDKITVADLCRKAKARGLGESA